MAIDMETKSSNKKLKELALLSNQKGPKDTKTKAENNNF